MQRSTAIELLQRAHQSVVLAAFPLDAPRQLCANRLNRPSLKVNIDVVRGALEFSLRDVPIHTQYAVADRKSTRLNSSHLGISYAVFCLKKQRKTCLTQSTELSRNHNTGCSIS